MLDFGLAACHKPCAVPPTCPFARSQSAYIIRLHLPPYPRKSIRLSTYATPMADSPMDYYI